MNSPIVFGVYLCSKVTGKLFNQTTPSTAGIGRHQARSIISVFQAKYTVIFPDLYGNMGFFSPLKGIFGTVAQPLV